MISAVTLAWIGSGSLFLTGLLTGVWKYAQMARSDKGRSHYYVDIAHRSALMYGFACVLIAHFAQMSALPDGVNTLAVAVQVVFFSLAVGSYVLHGFLGDTTNQLRSPHRLGKGEMPAVLIHGFMWALIVGEVGGFMTLFYGAYLGGWQL
ncbi:integral membrane protein [gamma proteobacterium HTCC5015]|nr:integral membrane protein [gamma proteobacterium HTCC5015]